MEASEAKKIEAFMTDREREMVLLCSSSTTVGYSRLAEKMGLSYGDAQQVGRDLQATRIAGVRLLKPGFKGSGIFLNDVGEQVKAHLIESGWVKGD